MNQYIESMKSYIADKASSPLLPAFTLSWCVINYRVFIYLFSSEPPKSKISGIGEVLNAGVFGGYWHALILPLLLAIIYVFGYPHLARRVMIYSENQKKETKKEFIRITEDSPRTAKEFHSLEEEYRLRNKELRDEVTKLEGGIDYYKKHNQDLSLSIGEASNKLQESENIAADLRASLDKRDKEIARLESNIRHISEAGERAEKSVSELKLTLHEQAAQISRLTSSLNVKDSHMGEATEKIKHLESQLADTLKTLDESRKENRNLTNELSLMKTAWLARERERDKALINDPEEFSQAMQEDINRSKIANSLVRRQDRGFRPLTPRKEED